MLFKPKCPVDAEEWEWLLAGFKWLAREFPEREAARRLALPTGEFFPVSRAQGEAAAAHAMDCVKAIAGIADWPVELIAVRRRQTGAVNAVAALQDEKGAAGTFRLARTPEGLPFAEICYTLDQLENRSALVATFAHEIAHYVLHMSRTPFPGGEELEELFTDLTAVWLGFGIFLGNNARYGHHVDEGNGRGWYVSGWQGYLGERMLMTALALSEMLAGRDPLAAGPYLKKHLEADVRSAQRFASRRNLQAELSAIDLADFGA
jgi:hypothetical protein